MIDMHREAYREEAGEVFSVHESSKQDHNPVDFDEMFSLSVKPVDQTKVKSAYSEVVE